MTKIIVTSFQIGAAPNKQFLENLRVFAEKHKVEQKYYFTMPGKYKDEEWMTEESHDFEPINGQVTLNDNLRLKDTRFLPQRVNPFLGLAKKLDPTYSYVVPSPKIWFESIASFGRTPRSFTSTGSATKPSYKSHTATGVTAEEQHQYGFTLIEIKDKRAFNLISVESNKSGSFHYLGEHYKDGKVTKKAPTAYILGDIHHRHLNEAAMEESLQFIEKYKPETVVLHDLFDGDSVNHWEGDKLIDRIQRFKQNNELLEDEVKQTYDFIADLAKRFPQVKWRVAPANHDERITRYLNSKAFTTRDPYNFLFAARIIENIIERSMDCLPAALSITGKIPKNFKFWSRGEVVKIRGVTVSAHGDIGASGSKGSPQGFININAKTASAHTHSPQLKSGHMVVGCLEEIDQPYTKGSPGKWMYANGILYDDGVMTLHILETNFK